MLWKGFYHDFSTKKASASGASPPDPHQGVLPLDPHRGHCPLDPRGSFALPNDLPWRPWLEKMLDFPGTWIKFPT